MRIKPDPMPDGLFSQDRLDDVMLKLCNHYAPHVIPYVQQQSGLETPAFIAVRLISGGSVAGRYVFEAYAISDDGCGDAL